MLNHVMRPQKCEAIRVVDGTNWEDFYWPQEVARIDEEVLHLLQSLELMEYEGVMKAEQLSFTDLARMSNLELQSIGISRYRHRRAIIEYFSEKCRQRKITIF